MIRTQRAILFLLTCFSLFENGIAQWVTDPTVNTPVSVGQVERYTEDIESDGEGGAFIVWGTYNFSPPAGTVFVQRISRNGEILWQEDGVRVSLTTQTQVVPQMCSDGEGGVIIVWEDYRLGNPDLFAQRINPAGERLWGDNGVAISTAFESQGFHSIVSDGTGGAIIAWRDLRFVVFGDIFAQRVNGAGMVQWTTDGLPICLAAGTQGDPEVASDGAGGAYITWPDNRPGGIYVQCVSAEGNIQWATDGIRVCTGGSCGGDFPKVLSSDGTGCFVTWRWGGIHAQRITNSGTRLFGANGIQTTSITGVHFEMISDGKGGVITATGLYLPAYNRTDIYTQRIAADGSLPWGYDGVPICTTHTGDLNHPRLCADGESGAIITWGDLRNDSIDVYAQRIDSGGTTRWTHQGTPVSLAAQDQQWPFALPDMNGGAIITWYLDRRYDKNQVGQIYYDIFAQNIDRYGFLGPTRPEITAVNDIPADQGGVVNITWTASALDDDTVTVADRYAVFRRNDSVSPWQWIASVPAVSQESYTFAAPTPEDSTATGVPLRYFLVQALNGDSSMQWNSFVDSGYSVDNLFPSPIVSLNASLQPDSTVLLTWPHNTIDPDIRGYAVYRAESTHVLTSPVKIAVTMDSTYTDSSYVLGTKAIYSIVTEDIHDNESLPSPEATVFTTRDFTYQFYTTGWHMISVPLVLNIYNKDTLFPSQEGMTAYRYNGGYLSTDTLSRGYGYWLKFAAPETTTITGYYRSIDTISVTTGWNMVGSLSEPVITQLIGSVPGGVVTSDFYAYHPVSGYSIADTLFSGKGYWVKVSQNAQLILSTVPGQSTTSGTNISINATRELPPYPPHLTDIGEPITVETMPRNFELRQNIPNPFNPVTTITYGLPTSSHVTLEIYNILGKAVVTLVDEYQEAGYKQVKFDGCNLPSGMYFYRLRAGNYTATMKMLLLK